MSLYKRLLSLSTIAGSIVVLYIIQVYYSFHSLYSSTSGTSSTSAAQLLADFTAIDLTSYSKERSRISIQERRRTTVVQNEDVVLSSQFKNINPKREPEIKLLLSPKELEWVKRRGKLFDGWYNQTALVIHRNSYPILRTPKVPASTAAAATSSTILHGRNQPIRADFFASTSSVTASAESSMQMPTRSHTKVIKSKYVDDDGPWLDFVIIGNP